MEKTLVLFQSFIVVFFFLNFSLSFIWSAIDRHLINSGGYRRGNLDDLTMRHI